MKRIKIFLVTFIIFQLFMCPFSHGTTEKSKSNSHSIKSYKDIPGVTEDEILALEELKKQKLGFTYGHVIETEAYKLPDGTYGGFTIELCKLLSTLFDTTFSPKAYNEWSEMKSALDKQEVDFSGGFMKTEERLKTYSMSIPIAGRSLKTYLLKDSKITSAEQLDGKRIGVMSGSDFLDMVVENYPTFHIEKVEISSYAEGVKLLEAGKIEAVMATSAADPKLMIYDTITSKDFFSLAYYPVSITTANPELNPVISVINKYLEAGGIEKVFELYEESQFEYKKNSLYLSFTDEERKYIENIQKNIKKVNIGLQHDAYPVSFYNNAEKEYQGISIDILKQITKLTGLEFEPLSTSETTTLATILAKLKTDEISMMTQLLRTESRKNDYIWSDVPYLSTNYALLSKIEYPEVKIHQIPWERVGTVNKSAHEVMFNLWFPDHKNQVIYHTTHEAFDALERGEIDLLMLSENMLLQQTNLNQKTGFKVNFSFGVMLESFFGFSKNETLLCSIVDKSMGYIDIDLISNVWMNRVFDYESEIAKVRSTYFMILALAILIVLAFIFYLFLKNRKLSKSLLEQTATLSTIYTSIPDTIFCINTEGVYTSCNPSFEKQVGLSEEEIIGKTQEEVCQGRITKIAEPYNELDNKILSERTISMMEEEVLLPDGSHKLLDMLKAPLIQNGAVVGILGIGRDVTERKEMQSRFDNIINAAQIAFILTIDGIITEANKYFLEHIGVGIGEHIQQIYDIPEQREEILQQVEQHGTSANNILGIKVANGGVHRFLTSISLTEYEKRKAHIVWALDIEQDEMRNDLLRETQLSFQAVLDILPVPIRIVDLESMEIVYVNSSLVELLGYASADEICGKNLRAILPEAFSNGATVESRMEQIGSATDSPQAIEMEYCKNTGEIIEAVVVARHIDYKGRSSSIGIIKDLTEQKERAQILLNAAEREKEANQAKSLFLANMSHEIRTPMNGIIGMTDLLMNEKLSERQSQYIKDIKASAESLLSIINDILDLSKITEGKLQIMPVDTNLSMMLNNTVSMMCFTAQTKGLSFIDNVRIENPEYVYIDDVRLNQIIINLLSNAIKFTKKGYVKFMVEIEDDKIVIEISDTGIGIKEEEIPLIFSAFEQADKNKNRAIKGTGLGLSITKNLVKLMGGEIWVTSEYGVGSTFHVTIPYIPGNEANVEEIDTKFEYIFAPTVQVLLVDDIQTNLTVGTGLLRLCGITSDVAISGAEAIDYVKENDYDIVFMDHMMPGMDGIEAMKMIRELGDRYKKLPIIALTANAVSESRELLLSSGMDDFLSKPIDKIELMNILKKWVPADKIKNHSKTEEEKQEVQYSEILKEASKIEELDVELALNYMGGLHEVLEKSIKQVAFMIDEKLTIMDECLMKGDLNGFAIDAHGLKGVLANIGAVKYSEIAATLEIGAKAENKPLCMEKFTIFASEIGEFAVKLKKIFREEDAEEKLPGEHTVLLEQTRKAIDYLEDFEASDAMECLKKIVEFTYGKEIDATLDKAMYATGRYSYNEAIRLLENIL